MDLFSKKIELHGPSDQSILLLTLPLYLFIIVILAISPPHNIKHLQVILLVLIIAIIVTLKLYLNGKSHYSKVIIENDTLTLVQTHSLRNTHHEVVLPLSRIRSFRRNPWSLLNKSFYLTTIDGLSLKINVCTTSKQGIISNFTLIEVPNEVLDAFSHLSSEEYQLMNFPVAKQWELVMFIFDELGIFIERAQLKG